MKLRKGRLATAVCVAGLAFPGQANAKIFVDNGWVVDGDVRHEILTTYSSSCNWDKLEFGTNGGLVQVGKFKEMPEVEGFISQQVNWQCGNGGYSHKKCPGSDTMWVTRKLGTQFVLFCLGKTVGTGH